MKGTKQKSRQGAAHSSAKSVSKKGGCNLGKQSQNPSLKNLHDPSAFFTTHAKSPTSAVLQDYMTFQKGPAKATSPGPLHGKSIKTQFARHAKNASHNSKEMPEYASYL